jgi:radical SAM/Cys-rich protein
MNEQLKRLDFLPGFKEHLADSEAAHTGVISTMQINLGSLCNQACKHCHVKGGPDRTDAVMGRDVMQACLDVYKANPDFETIDITGGAPEMNPDFEWLVDEACKLSDHVIVRTNLTVLDDEEHSHLPEFYRDHGVSLCASLPYYSEKDTDRQRGKGVFEKSIKMLKKLNDLGYGKDLELDLVYNPGGAFLPPAQAAIEAEFRQKLGDKYGIVFTNLFTITNNPIGRFGEFLDRSGNTEMYMNKLFAAYNPGAEPGMMCRFQISVGYDGTVYDCDFNQVVGLPCEGRKTIFDLRDEGLKPRNVVFANHCYACTAGQGSSCGGATD